MKDRNEPLVTDDDEDEQPTKFRDMARLWPKSTFLIMVNELCERFSYYGMRAVLTLYLLNILKFSDNTSTVFFHSFNVVSHITPLFGSILADGYIGKFWTIFSVSIVYAAGQVILAVGSTFAPGASVHPWLDLLGLFVIACGTGGIKPCVSAFGGDQFKPQYVLMISVYFSVFYFTINTGSTVSSYISPLFRAHSCMNHDSCYPLAFGIPAALMLGSIIIFMLGSPFYRKLPPKENAIALVTYTIKDALVKRFKSNVDTPPRSHWLEYSLDEHDCNTHKRCTVGKRPKCAQKQLVEDIKCLIRVCVMMLPVPIFWSLYDQQGSRWVIQAVSMDAQITDNFALLPDQMGTLNSFMIILFIPIFQTIVYPLVEKCGIRTTPCRRMVAGGFLAALAYVICGIVQLSVNKTLPDVPASNMAFVSVVNGYPTNSCNITIDVDGFATKFVAANSSLIDDKVTKTFQLYRMNVGRSAVRAFRVKSEKTSTCPGDSFNVTASLEGGKSYLLTATMNGYFIRDAKWKKPQEGSGQFAVGVNLDVDCAHLPQLEGVTCGPDFFNGSFALCRFDQECDPKKHSDYYAWKSSDSDAFKDLHVTLPNGDVVRRIALDYKDIRPGTYKLYLVNYLVDYDGDRTPDKSQIRTAPIEAYLQIKKMGGVFSWTVSTSSNGTIIANLHTIVPSNHVSILWQIPQYFVITVAEILFSITGYEFAYAQSARSLKSVVSAIWLFTQAVGDSIIILINALNLFDNLATEIFTYAGIMVGVIVVFMLLSIFYYEYKVIEQEEEDHEEPGPS